MKKDTQAQPGLDEFPAFRDLAQLVGRALARMWREEQQLVAGVIVRQVRAAAVQLFDDDSNVLMAEVSLFLDKVSNRSPGSLPRDHAIETSQGLPGTTDRGLRHPAVEDGPVRVEIGRSLWPRHVRNSIMFINNEQQ